MSHVNAYALERAEGGLILVDCGQGGHPTGLEALNAASRATGHDLSEVRDLVITHYDTDHMGNAAAVRAASGCIAWAHPRYERFFDVVEQPAAAEQRRRRMAVTNGATGDLAEGVASVREEVEGADAPVRPDRLLEQGVKFQTAVGEWQVIELPGHSPAQIGLWHDDRGLLISADVMVANFSAFGDAEGSEDPIGEWCDSIERVRKLAAHVALPGHGRPILDVARVTDLYRTKFSEHLDSAEGLLGRHPMHVADLMEARYPDPACPRLAVWRFLETSNLLTRLATSHRATSSTDDAGRITWALNAR